MRPVSGISFDTPPITMNTCSATVKARPVARSLPKLSRTASALRSPRVISTR